MSDGAQTRRAFGGVYAGWHDWGNIVGRQCDIRGQRPREESSGVDVPAVKWGRWFSLVLRLARGWSMTVKVTKPKMFPAVSCTWDLVTV